MATMGALSRRSFRLARRPPRPAVRGWAGRCSRSSRARVQSRSGPTTLASSNRRRKRAHRPFPRPVPRAVGQADRRGPELRRGGAEIQRRTHRYADVPDVVVLDDIWWFDFALSGISPHWMSCSAKSVWTPRITSTRCWPDYHSRPPLCAAVCRSTPLFYYNKAAWEAAGLPDRGPTSGKSSANGVRELQRAVGDRRWAHGRANAQSISWTFEGTELGIRRRLLR